MSDIDNFRSDEVDNDAFVPWNKFRDAGKGDNDRMLALPAHEHHSIRVKSRHSLASCDPKLHGAPVTQYERNLAWNRYHQVLFSNCFLAFRPSNKSIA